VPLAMPVLQLVTVFRWPLLGRGYCQSIPNGAANDAAGSQVVNVLKWAPWIVVSTHEECNAEPDCDRGPTLLQIDARIRQ
jgi:hypothetical protein